MSLFKARDWWSTVSGYEEYHDLGCLAVGNLDNSSSGLDKIVVGSFQGLVRIYDPCPHGFSADNVILEKQFSAPVLQVAIGRFITISPKGSSNVHLAVLHPRELLVCTLTSEQTTDNTLVYVLTPVYKHTLCRSACNMTWGGFGGSRDCDYLCVQSMDGQLSFYNQDSPTFSCFLPDFMLPGPLAYIARTDSLVTVNSAHSLQVFRYQSLSVAGGRSVGTTRPPIGSGKKFLADWSSNLGENIIDLSVTPSTNGNTQILILDEECGSIQYLLATHSNQLLVFRDTCLQWTASLTYSPVDITTGNFKELNGVVVSLDELGHVTCSYLGTDPALFAAGKRRRTTIAYDEIAQEMVRLNQTIKHSQTRGMFVDGGSGQAALVLESQVGTVRVVQLDDEHPPDAVQSSEEGADVPLKKCVEVKVLVRSSSGPSLKNVSLSVVAALPLTTHPSHFTLANVSSTQTPKPLIVTVVATPTLFPTSTTLTISGTYMSTQGTPQVLTHEVELPIQLFCQPSVPEKVASHKITVDTNHHVKDLSQLLFSEHLLLFTASSNAIGLLFLNGAKLTIVASPSSPRYRLQSDSLPAIGVGLNILLSMLRRHVNPQDPPFQAEFTPPLPLNEYFEIIERHYTLRGNIEHCKDWLSRHSQQFRAIQKRLLTRFKDKTPVGLAHLDTLLDGTYMQLMALAERNELFQLELQESSNQLACATQLINTLLRLATSMSDEDFTILSAALSSHVTMDTDQGWEECTDAAITHLLRTTLSKSQKEQSVTLSSVAMPSESSKIKKHIALLCDRLIKGWLPATGKPEATQSLSNTDDTPPKAPPTIKLQHASDVVTQGTSTGGIKVIRGKFKQKLSPLPSLTEVGETSEDVLEHPAPAEWQLQ